VIRPESVRSLLDLLDAGELPNDDGVEYAVGDRVNLAAYRGLARSRGVELRQVLVAAAGDELRSIVALPAVETRADGAPR